VTSERFHFEYAPKILKSPDQRRESTGKLKVSAEWNGFTLSMPPKFSNLLTKGENRPANSR